MRPTLCTLVILALSGGAFAQQPTKTTPSQPNSEPKAEPKKDKDPEVSEFEKRLKQELDGTTDEAIAARREERPSWFWQIVKTTFVLAILLSIFYGGWKVFAFKQSLPAMQSEVIQVLYEYTLMPGKHIQIVDMTSKLLVLGISDAGIQLISEVTEKAKIDQIKLDCEKERGKGKPDFLLELTRAVRDKVGEWSSPQKNVARTDPDDSEGWQQTRQRTRDTLDNLRDGRQNLDSEEQPH